MEIGSFKIPGHSTKREWAVYIFVAFPRDSKGKTKLYVGKVGDNRDGCNPVISRVGNHFSHNRIHSQIRNSIKNTEDYDYEYFYCHFGVYDKENNMQKAERSRINELERELNRIVQKRIEQQANFELLNPYKGKHISKAISEKRKKLINQNERKILEQLIDKALTNNAL